LLGQRDDSSLVILKEVYLLELSAAERQLALNEARILESLDHPNVIAYYDCFEQDGMLEIEMEYADGGSLDQLLKSHGASEEKGDTISLQWSLA
jgi:serine/threonine protein kinase